MKSQNKLLAIVIALQLMILVASPGRGSSANVARADGIPDAGAQRDQMIEQMKATNEKLDKLLTLLTGGDLKVKVIRQDDAGNH